MAKKSSNAMGMSYPDDDYMCGIDADTLAKAAEIMADKPRFDKAKAHFQKRQEGVDKLTSGLRRKA